MYGADGAIDRVWMEDGRIKSSVIGGGKAKGICGSGLIDAVAVALDAGLVNKRGRIQTHEEVDGQRVLLAGAFGNFLNPASACRIDLLPFELEDKITAVSNAAGSGAKILACDSEALNISQALVDKIEFLELASLPEFSRTFAKSMGFREEIQT